MDTPIEVPEPHVVLDAMLVKHRFWLREDICVTIALPQNLTVNESERVAKWIQTLPFRREA